MKSEKDKEIAYLNAKLFIKKNAEQELEYANAELARLKIELKESEDTNFHISADLTRRDWEIKKLEVKLAQLKEFQIWIYKRYMGDGSKNILDLDYAEWCKQNTN